MARYTLEELKKLVGTVVTNSPSAAGNWLLPRIIFIEKGLATMEVVIRPEMCNPYHNIHGGMMSLVIDEAIGWAIVSAQLDIQYTSVSLNIDFLYAASVGETIAATARIIRAGKKIVNVVVDVHNSEGKLLAKGNSNLVSTSMQIKY